MASITKSSLPQHSRNRDQNEKDGGRVSTQHNVADHTNGHLLKRDRDGGGNKSYHVLKAEEEISLSKQGWEYGNTYDCTILKPVLTKL